MIISNNMKRDALQQIRRVFASVQRAYRRQSVLWHLALRTVFAASVLSGTSLAQASAQQTLTASEPCLSIPQKYAQNQPWLGKETQSERETRDDTGHYAVYEHGWIYWSPATCAHTIGGAIFGKYAELGWETGYLHFPVTDEIGAPDGVGRFQVFQGGAVYWTPGTDAHTITGAIRDKWASVGWERSFLGYPVTDEKPTPDGDGRFNYFQGGAVYWHPRTGVHIIAGSILDKWAELGYERSWLGYPVSDELPTPDNQGRYSRFQNGYIAWSADTGARAFMGAYNLSSPQHVRVTFDLYCEEQNENGDDEIYVTAGSVRLPSARADAPREPIFSGEVSDSDDDINRHYLRDIYVGDYDLQQGQVTAAMVHVFESDGDDYRPVVEWTLKAAQKAAASVTGDTSINDIDVSGFMQATSSFWENSDDYIGSFLVLMERNPQGGVDVEIHPLARARPVSGSPGPLRLDGDGAEYYPSVYINGQRIIYGHH